MNDLTYAVRQLVRHPGFTAIAVLTLALGIGATTAVFAVLRSVVLDPLPYPDDGELVVIDSPVPGMGEGVAWNVSEAGYFHFREASRALAEVGTYVTSRANLTGAGRAERVAWGRVSASLLDLLGARPILGRLPGAAADQPGTPNVVVLGHDFWVRSFGADSAVVGNVVELQTVPYEIIGVMAPGVHLPDYPVDVWSPLRLDPLRAPQNSHYLPVIARLASGFTVVSASRELAQLSTRFPELFPQAYSDQFMEEFGFTTRARPLSEQVVGDFAGIMWIVLVAVALVLVIAAANVANLFAVRTEARRRELAVRLALGAGRRHVLRQGLIEGAVFGVLSAVVGVALAEGGVRLLLALAPSGIPRLREIAVTGWDVGLAAAVALVAGIAVGLFPVFVARVDVSVLRDASAGRTGAPRQHLVRRVLVGGQVALALVLLASAGLMVRSWQRLNAVRPGMDTEGVITFDLTLPVSRYRDYEDTFRYYRDLVAGVEALPGVVRAGAGPVPMRDFGVCAYIIPEERQAASDEPGCIPRPIATPGYFEALGVSVDGLASDWNDVESGTPGVVLTAALAQRFWPGENPIGKGVRPNEPGEPYYRVVGVTGALRANGLDRPPTEAAFLPVIPMEGISHWGPPRSMTLIVRTATGSPEAVVPDVRRVVNALDPDVPVGNVMTMDRVVARSMARRSFTMLLLGVASGLALVLSVVGLYGVVAYVVRRRTAEIGIRVALGACARDISGMVLRDGLVVALSGAGVGVVAAVVVTRALRSLLFEVSPTDPLTLTLVTVMLIAVTVVATLVPARRAARVDPMEALRHE